MKLYLIFVSALLALSLISACNNVAPQSPEQRVFNTLAAMEQAAEQRSVADFMQYVSEAYTDHQGLSKSDIRRIVQLQYLRNQSIHILSQVTDLKVDGNLASVEIVTAMASKAGDLQAQEKRQARDVMDIDFSRVKADTHRFSAVFRSTDQQQSWLLESVSVETWLELASTIFSAYRQFYPEIHLEKLSTSTFSLILRASQRRP